MDKIIYTDIDVTLLDFNVSFESYLRSIDYIGDQYPIGFLKGENNLAAVMGIPAEESAQLVHDFFETSHFSELPAIEGSVEAVQSLYRDGWRFIAISACPSSVGAEARKSNLENVFNIPFEEVHLTGFGGCKREILSQFKPTIWVEDHVGHANVGHELGYRSYLLTHKHNKGVRTDAFRMDDWWGIVDDILQYVAV